MKLQTILMSAAAFAALVACTPAAETPAPVAPAPADIASATPEAGPAAENTTDTLASAPADAAATPPAATATPTVSPAPPAAPAAAAGPTKAQLASGAAVYARTCAMCHGPTGAGTQMGVGLTAGLEYAVIKEKVTKGPINSGDKMPPLASAMSAEELSDVAHYIEAGFPQ